MRSILVSVASAFACLTAGAVTLPQAPGNGSVLAELDRKLFQCRSVDRHTQCRRRSKEAERIEAEPITEIVLFYRDDKLVRSVFTFSEAHLDRLVQQLSQRLGAPIPGSERLKAGMGGVFENRYFIWKRDGHAWFVEQFFERITDSGLWTMSESELDTLLAERERQRVRGARDL